ncbi:Penicillin-binding protein 4* [compost metagenome]
MQEEGVPGCALCMIHEGGIDQIKYMGYANKKARSPITEDTIFQVGSISKSLTSWAIMKLAEQHVLELDEPIERYLRTWYFLPSPYNTHNITIRQLLSHTAGINIKSYLGVRNPKNVYSTTDSLFGNYYKSTKVRIVQQPGESYLYSGGGYTLLQHIIEIVTDMTFDKYMEQEILSPLGIQGNYRIPKNSEYLQANAYGAFGELQPTYYFPEMSAAGLYMTLKGLSTFVLAHFSDEHGLIKCSSLDQMFKKIRIHILYGLGYFVRHTQSKPHIFSMGRNRGYFSRFDIFYHHNEAFIILTNSINGSNLTNRLLLPWYQYQLNNTEPNKDALFLNNTSKISSFFKERLFLLQHLF